MNDFVYCFPGLSGLFPLNKEPFMAQNKHVTLVITHTLLPEQAQRYEQWLGKIMPVAAEFPGHLGRT